MNRRKGRRAADFTLGRQADVGHSVRTLKSSLEGLLI